ncbi:MAG: site-specific integrase [Bauldia sp.]|nr:site-specific integrase [Bauldia sp.]
MAFRVSITKQDRQRRLKSGSSVVQTRYFVNYRDPKTGERRLPSFERQKDAVAFRNQLVAAIETGTYSPERKAPTVAEAVERFLHSKSGSVRPRTIRGYREACKLITGPVLEGTAKERARHTIKGEVPAGAKMVPLLGAVRINDLTTADIRAWHRTVQSLVSVAMANRAKMVLGAVMQLAAEDFNIRPPAMPSQLPRRAAKPTKRILTPDQVRQLIAAARADKEHGVYYAFPFLAGTRPSEQFALLWEDIDFDRNVISIRRSQEPDGSIIDLTKTRAGVRDVPMGSTLRGMLLEWRVACPRRGGELYRVFPGPGRVQPWPHKRVGGGGPIWYQNFRTRYWRPTFERLGLPYVTPHSARHSFISTLQAEGIEVGLVAKLAGHASAVVTLGHYTHAVRGGDAAIAALERAYGGVHDGP